MSFHVATATAEQRARNSIEARHILVLHQRTGPDLILVMDKSRIDPFTEGFDGLSTELLGWTAKVKPGTGRKLARQWFPNVRIDVQHYDGRLETDVER
jgi:hypothetical protein